MARRVDHTRTQLKKLAIAAGRNLIIEGGYKNLTARHVAAEIGYTIGTLYNVFEDFDDLRLHIHGETLDGLLGYIKQNLSAEYQGPNQLKQLASLYLEYAQQNFALWQALLAYIRPADGQIPAWYQEKIIALFDVLEKTIQNFLGKRNDNHRHARILWASLHGMYVLFQTGKFTAIEAENPQILISTFIETYIKGMKS